MSIFRGYSISRLFWVLPGILLVGLVAVGVVSMDSSAPASFDHQETERREAPDFTLNPLEGDTFHLQDHRGTVVVLNFWATWCPPCRREIPHFVRMQEELGDRGLQFVGVALERDAGPDDVRAFAEKMGINYPIGMGDGTIAKKYGGVRGLPMTFIIGPEGEIRGRVPGMTTESMLRPKLEALLEEAS